MIELEKQAEEYTNQQGMPEMKSKYVYEAIKQAYIKGHQDANKWVSVSEQLPTEYGRYLIYRAGCDKIQFETWNNTGWAYCNNDCTHWMPLPENPLK